jgi:hypothetical protein
MPRDQSDSHQPDAFTPETLGLAADMRDGVLLMEPQPAGCATVEARLGQNSLWLVIRAGGGALALRTAHAVSRLTAAPVRDSGELCAFTAQSPEGAFRVAVEHKGDRLLRARTWLTPREPLLVPFWPRDLYPLGPGDDPTQARGEVIAAQRGFNAAVVFLRLDPQETGALYFQNLTALTPWFKATDAKPQASVGGQWPELGYQPPASPEGQRPAKNPLPAGEEILVSDAFVALYPVAPKGEQEEADAFLEGLAAIYPHLDKPNPEFRDWPAMAERTLRGLSRSPKVKVERYGHTYVRPYTDAEVPDSMAQLAVLLPMLDYAAWRGRPAPIAGDMRAGIGKFFDAKLGSVRRYLPNVADGTEPIEKAKDKDANEVDSWYLYHPLANIGRLALGGDAEAKDIFLGSLDFAIKVARHFKYDWPVLFDVMSLKPNVEARKPDGHGQTDVGGLYAYLMIQAHELTGEQRFLDEAKKGVEATKGLGFELLYQTNITAWAVVACAKLWRMTGDDFFRRQSHLFIAGFFHNTIFWESELDAAATYQTFLGATCLHDAPYMAIYECFESFTAFREYLEMADDGLPESLRLLLNEYCRYALSRAWGFFPSELPADVLAKENRNGHIDRALAFPLEDLYADGQQPGQVGQEIYGGGAAFAFAIHGFQRAKGAPAMVFCDYPVRNGAFSPGGWSARIDGWPQGQCRLRLIAPPGRIRGVSARVDGLDRPLERVEPGVWELTGPGCGEVAFSWSVVRKPRT